MSDIKTTLIEQSQHIPAKATAAASYTLSGGLVVGDAMNYLNEYAGAFGIFLGFCTFLLNWYYLRDRSKWLKRQGKE